MSEHVRINGQIYLYKEKAPFVPSGESVMGALEFDSAGDKLKCHECGKWFHHLGSHVVNAHEMPALQYKTAHGLRRGTALIGERVRAKLIKSGKRAKVKISHVGQRTRFQAGRTGGAPSGIDYERRNKRGSCHAQIMESLRRLAQNLGRTPTRGEAQAVGIHVASAEAAFNAPWAQILKLAGMLPIKAGQQVTPPKYSPAVLKTMLRDFWMQHMRLPSQSDFRRGILPNAKAFVRCFGSVARAFIESEIADPSDLTGKRLAAYRRSLNGHHAGGES